MMTSRPVPIDLRTPGTSFVAREQELARLSTALAAAADGSPSSLLIAGEAGVGKTRLVHEFARRMGGEAQVLLGSCIQLRGGGLPYGPIVDALRPLVRHLDLAELDVLLGPTLGDLTRLLPAAMPQPPRRPAEPAGEFAQARLFELMLRFLDRLAQQRPVVVIVEDVHWADASTLDLLTFLVRMVRQERLLFVTTYRSDELHPQHPLRVTIAELKRSRHVEHMELARFDRAELTALLAGILGRPPSADVVQRIFARSDGNAFLAEELLAAEGSQTYLELPPRLQDLLLARVSSLANDTRHVLRVAATVGRPTEHHLLAAASQLPEARLLTAVREAVDGQLVLTTKDAYAFRHMLLQEAVYSELLPGERRRLHAAVARALTEDLHGGTLPETAAELSHHWHAARHYPQALNASISAARAAADIYGFTEAHLQYERALSLWEQVPDAHDQAGLAVADLRLEAAEAARWVGVPDRAAALIQEALADIGGHIEPARAGLLLARLAECQSEAGDSKAALAAYEEATRLVANELATAEKARVLAGHGTELMRQGHYSASRALCERAIAVARVANAQAEEGRALNTLGCDLASLGDPEAGITALRQALTLSEAAGSFDDLHRVYLNLSVVLGLDAGRPHEALQVTQRGLERMHELGLALALPGSTLRGELGWQLWDLGRWQEAEELVSKELTRELPAAWALHLRLLAGRLHMARGRFDLAHEQGQTAARMVEQLIDPLLHSFLQAYLAELAIFQGDYSTARSAVAKALQHLTDSEEHAFAVRWCRTGLRAAADAAQRAHDRRAGPSVVADIHETGERLLADARLSLAQLGMNLPGAKAEGAGCEAEFARLELRSDPREWAALAASWDALFRPYEAIYARWRQAEALLATRAPRAAGGVLRRAHHGTVELGERPLRHEIERLAQRARIDLQPPSPKPRNTSTRRAGTEPGLTPREQEVLQHLVEGRTNRQIARSLFISEKTASVHVSNIMSKLGATNRSEAAAIAHRLRLTEPDVELDEAARRGGVPSESGAIRSNEESI
jgi:predicted ATPase/DNA-binding CsgD family transcriptional regulator